MIELGGNINLDGFEKIESGNLIVVKKVVGNYTKNISEKVKDFKKITISLKKEGGFLIYVKVDSENEIISEAKASNLFFALDKALSGILNKIS
ncbi:hypothetical protein K8R33_04420 [archaeon]|nr:hypothetical protein [archaeon]